MGVIEKSGSWFSYEGDRLGQGRDNACDFLNENPKIAGEIERKLRVQMGLPVRGLTVVEGGAADAAQAKDGAESDEAKTRKARATK
jgi:recombination protein RecA